MASALWQSAGSLKPCAALRLSLSLSSGGSGGLLVSTAATPLPTLRGRRCVLRGSLRSGAGSGSRERS
eukprot:14707294-Heterocapsa_arctica.AAC.1